MFPRVLFSGSSKFNKNIKVVRFRGVTKLLVDGWIQSTTDNSAVWKEISELVIGTTHINSVLLLGMGAGTMLKNMHKNTVSVEIDQTIVDLAVKYFELGSVANNKIIVADAYDVVLNSANYGIVKKFDCIIVDTYRGNSFPEKLESKEFLAGILGLATENGLIIFNRVFSKKEPELIEKFKTVLAPYIPKVEVKKVPWPSIADNYVYFGRNHGVPSLGSRSLSTPIHPLTLQANIKNNSIKNISGFMLTVPAKR